VRANKKAFANEKGRKTPAKAWGGEALHNKKGSKILR
jgi:hypothetical protein